jgi:6-phosphogluconolactonase
MHIKRTISLLGLVFLALVMSGCGGHDFWAPANPGSSSGNNPTGAVTKFAFAANFNNGAAGSVSAYTVDNSSGALTAVSGSPFAAGTGTVAVGADTAGKFVFAANQGGDVSAFTVDRTTGVLTEVTGSPFLAGTSPSWVAVDPAGRFVYVVNAGSNDVSGYAVNTTSGALTAFSATVLTGTPLGAKVDPGGHFLYVALGATGTAIFKISSTDGTLTATGTVSPAPCAASNDVALDPNSKFLFIAGDTGICNYAVNGSNGDLTLISSSVITAGTKPVAVAVGANGKFLFAANQGSNNVSGFTIGADGTLTAMSGSPFATGATPADVTVDPSGSFVYTANFGADTLSLFTISSSTLVAKGTVATGATPNSVVTTQ